MKTKMFPTDALRVTLFKYTSSSAEETEILMPVNLVEAKARNKELLTKELSNEA
jgi:hypothetical protein